MPLWLYRVRFRWELFARGLDFKSAIAYPVDEATKDMEPDPVWAAVSEISYMNSEG
jgi:hypothetical protein